MKKLLFSLLLLSSVADAQQYAYWPPPPTGPGTGTVTSITAGTGLSGGTITGSGTISLTTPVAVSFGGTGTTTSTGSGSVVLSNSPSLTTPALDTPSSVVLTNGTGLPLTTGVTGILPVANGGTGSSTVNFLQALNGDVTTSAYGTAAATISANAVTNAKMAQMAADTIKGNNTAGTANASDLTAAQVAAILPAFVGDSGSGGTQGLVPAPGAATAQYNDYLGAGGTWSYVDQSKPIYNPFSFINQTASPLTTTKYENIAVYTGIDGHKQYAIIVAGGTGTIYIYDVTNPAIPLYLNKMTLAGAYNISIATISGAIYAFVPSSGSSVLYTINITNPLSLSTTASLTLSGSPGSLYSCVYAAGYVYVATQNKGLTVVDVGGGLAGGTLTAPVQSFQEGGTTNKTAGVAISGSYVYTTNYQTSFPATVRYLKTWELAAGGGTLAVPFLANTFTVSGGPTGTSSKPQGVSINSAGTTAYVTDGNQLVYDIIDITTPTSPAYLTYIRPTFASIPNNTLGVAIPTGNFLYIYSGSNATYGGAIDLWDFTNRSFPVKVATTYNNDPSSPFGGIALANGYIYAADYGSAAGLSYLDIFSAPLLTPALGEVTSSTLSTFGLSEGVNLQTAAYTATATDTAVMANGTSGAFSVTLPTAVGISGKLYVVKKTDSSANAITVATTSSQTIDGSTTYSLSTQYKYVQVISDGSNWNVISNN